MGCIIVKALDPSPPNNAIVDFWHIGGVLLDHNDDQRVQVAFFAIFSNKSILAVLSRRSLCV